VREDRTAQRWRGRLSGALRPQPRRHRGFPHRNGAAPAAGSTHLGLYAEQGTWATKLCSHSCSAGPFREGGGEVVIECKTRAHRARIYTRLVFRGAGAMVGRRPMDSSMVSQAAAARAITRFARPPCSAIICASTPLAFTGTPTANTHRRCEPRRAPGARRRLMTRRRVLRKVGIAGARRDRCVRASRCALRLLTGAMAMPRVIALPASQVRESPVRRRCSRDRRPLSSGSGVAFAIS
jgi:hypothetical protein